MHSHTDWYSDWSDDARECFLGELLRTAFQEEDDLAGLFGALDVDASIMALLNAEVDVQVRMARTEEGQRRVAARWVEFWSDELKNALLNQLEALDQVSRVCLNFGVVDHMWVTIIT